MPAARERSVSYLNALALRAMIGILSAPRYLPYFGSCLIAVHNRHLDIHQDTILNLTFAITPNIDKFCRVPDIMLEDWTM